MGQMTPHSTGADRPLSLLDTDDELTPVQTASAVLLKLSRGPTRRLVADLSLSGVTL